MVFNIPVELFLGFIGASIAMAIFGFIRQPQIPAMLTFAGMFILVMVVATDNIIFGYSEPILQKTTETTLEGTTTFEYNSIDPVTNMYEFTELPKVLFALLGAIFMLSGALMLVKNQ